MTKQVTAKHYVFLLIWGLTLTFALFKHSLWLGVLFMFGFFLVSVFKILDTMIITTIIAFVLTLILEIFFPPTAVIFTGLFVVMLLLRAKFLIQNWRALVAGLYTYGVYLFVVVANALLFKASGAGFVMMIGGIFSADATRYGSFTGLIIAGVLAIFLTRGLNRKFSWLYSHGYDTNRALLIMGLTPLIVISIILPFLKIKINGHEIFDGSLSDTFDADVDADADVASTVAPPEVTNALKFADIDLNDMIVGRAAEQVLPFSHAIEASVLSTTAGAIYSAGKLLKFRNRDGSTQAIRYLDDTNAVIEEESGRRIGYITFDREKNLEHVRLTDGFTYTIDIADGNIFDADGKLIGKISEGNDGKKLLVGRDDKVIREF
ncbi:MAG: hypothetical protein IJ774_06675 [Selenomonadaceae bacterium]|nr:hypothetical protein [Selenomonadaceae bacterium]